MVDKPLMRPYFWWGRWGGWTVSFRGGGVTKSRAKSRDVYSCLKNRHGVSDMVNWPREVGFRKIEHTYHIVYNLWYNIIIYLYMIMIIGFFPIIIWYILMIDLIFNTIYLQYNISYLIYYVYRYISYYIWYVYIICDTCYNSWYI